MSNISSVSGPVVPSGASLDRGAGLDGDALLLFCQAQLNDLNGDIKDQMAQQQAARAQKQAITKVRSLLAKYSQQGIYSGDEGAKFDICKAYAEAISKMPAGPNKDALMTQFDAFRSSGFYNGAPAPKVKLDNEADCVKYVWEKGDTNPHGLDYGLHSKETKEKSSAPATEPQNQHNTLVAGEISAQIAALDGVGEEIGKDTELKFIELTSLITKRQACLQQVTGFMNKVDQGLELVASNIGK